MIISPLSAFGNALVPTLATNPTLLPSLQSPTGSTAAATLFPTTSQATASATAAVAALAAQAQNPYAAALAAAGLSPTNGFVPQAPSYFEGTPIYLLSNTSAIAPFVMPKVPDFSLNVSTTGTATQPRVDTSKHFHVFVGDLSSEIDNKSLKEAFAPFGEISDTKVIRDLQTLKSKGYGFVSFIKREDAEKAIDQMNGQWLGRRTVRTNWASRKLGASTSSSCTSVIKDRDRDKDRDRANGADSNGDQANDDCGPPARKRQIKSFTFEEIMSQASSVNSTVYVGGFTSSITDDELKQIFAKYGTIVETRIFRQQGYAFVKFDQKESAAQAILHVNNTEINGYHIRCSWGKEGGGSTNSNLNFGYNLATAMGNGLGNVWSQYYQCYNNPTLIQQWQNYWQQQQQLGTSNGMIMNGSNTQ